MRPAALAALVAAVLPVRRYPTVTIQNLRIVTRDLVEGSTFYFNVAHAQDIKAVDVDGNEQDGELFCYSRADGMSEFIQVQFAGQRMRYKFYQTIHDYNVWCAIINGT